MNQWNHCQVYYWIYDAGIEAEACIHASPLSQVATMCSVKMSYCEQILNCYLFQIHWSKRSKIVRETMLTVTTLPRASSARSNSDALKEPLPSESRTMNACCQAHHTTIHTQHTLTTDIHITSVMITMSRTKPMFQQLYVTCSMILSPAHRMKQWHKRIVLFSEYDLNNLSTCICQLYINKLT